MVFIIYKVSGGRALFSAVSDPGGAGIQAGAPHYIKPFYFHLQDSGRYDWPHQERQTKLKRFNTGFAVAADLDRAGRGSGGPAGRAGIIQAGREFLQGRDSSGGPGVHLQVRGNIPAGTYWFLDSYKDYIKLFV